MHLLSLPPTHTEDGLDVRLSDTGDVQPGHDIYVGLVDGELNRSCSSMRGSKPPDFLGKSSNFTSQYTGGVELPPPLLAAGVGLSYRVAVVF